MMLSMRAHFRNSVRERRRFQQVLGDILESQWYSREQLKELQWRTVRRLIRHAVENVPYYQSLFSHHGLHVENINSLDDLHTIPFLTKQDILKFDRQLIAGNVNSVTIKANTSGSTGTPLVLAQDRETVIRENAFIWRQLKWAGFKHGQRRVWLRGDMIVPFEQKEPPFWRKCSVDNMLMMSSYHLSESNAAAYIDALEQFDPVLIQAYPSSIAYLARFLEVSGRPYRGSSLKSVVTASETLTDNDRDLIERWLHCRVFQQYGSAERVTMIHTCEKGRYHIDSDYGFTELVPIGDGTYEIVGTGFNNWLMPLIRYRSGDTLQIPESEEDCPCGRMLPIVTKINGRMDDYLKTVDGRKIGRLDHIFKGISHVAEAQLVQERIDKVTIRLVPFKKFSDEDRKRLVNNAKDRLGKEMTIGVEIVNEIPRTRSGKFRAVICNV
jgi:phenylacetate-CoA ligase